MAISVRGKSAVTPYRRHAAVATTAFSPVTLAELDTEAALQTRVDRKDVIPIEEVSTVLAALPSASRVLEIDERRSFGYESIYFDTPDLRCYLDAARRRTTASTARRQSRQ